MSASVVTLVAQNHCPACGSAISSGGGGIAFASASFACGCELQTANGEIVIASPCPAPTHVAVKALNEVVRQIAAKPGTA